MVACALTVALGVHASGVAAQQAKEKNLILYQQFVTRIIMLHISTKRVYIISLKGVIPPPKQ